MAFARLPKFAFPEVMLPVTSRDDNVPTDVILGCAAVVTVPAVDTVPDTLAAGILVKPAPEPYSLRCRQIDQNR